MLKISGFQKSYGNKAVLDIPFAEIPHGLHLVQGRNGSGKSTLFRCLAGISPFIGSVVLGQTDLKSNPVSYRRRVNFSEAEPVYPAVLSGRELLEFSAAVRETDAGKVEELAGRLGLDLYFENPAGTYSSGMSKKIAVAMAFLGRPDLIILDEPFNALDAASCLALQELISEELKSGTSFLISSHTEIFPEDFPAGNTYRIEGGLFQPG